MPAENLMLFDLVDGRSFALRPSGTEPKIKYYLFAHGEKGVDPAVSKVAVEAGLAALWAALEADAAQRV